MDRYSKQQIVDAAGVSDGQVAIMRRVKKTLGEAAYDGPSWWRAQRDAKGIASTDFNEDDRERWLEEQAQHYADRLSKEFGTKLPGNTEVAARALAIHFGRRLGDLASALRDHLPEPEGNEGDDEESDF